MPKVLKLTQPPVFYMAVSTSLCERFGFYILSFLIVLYAKSVFDFSDTQAFTLFAVFTSLAYITPVIGGFLADNFLGIRRTLIIGLLFEGAGLMLLAIPSNTFFTLALSLIVIGVGFFKTSPTNLLARSYRPKDPRIDTGFTLFYMGINVGAFFSSLSAGIIQRYIGWHAAFLTAGSVLFVGLLSYAFLRKTAASIDSSPGNKPLPLKMLSYISLATLVTVVAFTSLIQHADVAYGFFSVSTLVLALFLAYEIFRSRPQDKLKIIACILLILMGMVFFILYFQAFTSINLFVKRCVNHEILGLHIPTVTFLSLNSLWVLILSPLLAMLYHVLAKRGADPAITTKFPLGLLIITGCFFLLAYSVGYTDSNGLVSSWWMIAAYGLYSLGELLISALGVAMVTHISPKRMYGIMMGAWYLASALAASVASRLANLSDIPKTLHDQLLILSTYQHAFLEIALIGTVATIISFIAAPYIRKIAQLG